MIHQPSGGARGQASNIEIQAREILKTKELGAKILAENCGQKVEKILKDFNRDYWMDADESIAYGIVDGILE
jgi:ATP-dependent Clp protease protease subunit